MSEILTSLTVYSFKQLAELNPSIFFCQFSRQLNSQSLGFNFLERSEAIKLCLRDNFIRPINTMAKIYLKQIKKVQIGKVRFYFR